MASDRSTSERAQIKQEDCEDGMLPPGQSSDGQPISIPKLSMSPQPACWIAPAAHMFVQDQALAVSMQEPQLSKSATDHKSGCAQKENPFTRLLMGYDSPAVGTMPTSAPSDEVHHQSASNTRPSPRTVVQQTATNHNDANEPGSDYAHLFNDASDRESTDDDYSGSSGEDERHLNSQHWFIRKSTRAATKRKLFPIEQGRASDAPASSRRVPVTQRWIWADSSESEDSDVPLSQSRANRRAIAEQSNKLSNTSKMEAVSRLIVKLKLPTERLRELSCKSQSTGPPYTKMMATGPTSVREPDHNDEPNHPSSQSKRKSDIDLQSGEHKRLQLESREIMNSWNKMQLSSRIPDDSADSDEEEEDTAMRLDTTQHELPAEAAFQRASTPPEVPATPSTQHNESGLKQEEVILAKVSWSKDESGSVQVRLDDCPGCHVFWERVLKMEHLFKQPSNNKGMVRIAKFNTKSLPDGIDKDIFKVPFTDEAYESTYHELYWDLRRLQALHPGDKIRVPVKIKWVKMKEEIGLSARC